MRKKSFVATANTFQKHKRNLKDVRTKSPDIILLSTQLNTGYLTTCRFGHPVRRKAPSARALSHALCSCCGEIFTPGRGRNCSRIRSISGVRCAMSTRKRAMTIVLENPQYKDSNSGKVQVRSAHFILTYTLQFSTSPTPTTATPTPTTATVRKSGTDRPSIT